MGRRGKRMRWRERKRKRMRWRERKRKRRGRMRRRNKRRRKGRRRREKRRRRRFFFLHSVKTIKIANLSAIASGCQELYVMEQLPPRIDPHNNKFR